MFKRLDFWLGCGYAWDVGGYAFFFHLCVLHLHSQKAVTGVVACGGSYWLNHGILAMVVVLVAWLGLSFEAPAMEVMGLIQRWRDQAGEERREERLKA